MKRIMLFFLLPLSLFQNGYAQLRLKDRDALINEIVEKMVENRDPEADYSDLVLELESIAEHPMDLNRADETQLSRLCFLSRLECQSLVQHRTQYGNYLSVYELQCVEGLSSASLFYLPNFVTIQTTHADHKGIADALRKGNHLLSCLHEQDLENRKGYQPVSETNELGTYAGSPFRYVMRYRYTTGNFLSIGYAGEKDMGETMQGGFDFQSMHLYYKPARGLITAWVVGDYLVGFGQGLTLGCGTGARKSALITQLTRTYPEIRPYRSLGEQDFLRGVALTMKRGAFRLTTFASRQSLSSSVDTETGMVSGMQSTGLHRTSRELEQKDNLKELIAGTHISYQRPNAFWGLTTVMHQYHRAFVRKDEPYQQFQQNEDILFKAGSDFQIRWSNLLCNGEISLSSNRAVSGLVWLLVPLDEKLDVAILYRNYEPSQPTRFVNAFAEAGTAGNEQGLFTGIQYKVTRHFTCNAYLDIFRSGWLRYRIDAPSAGRDWLWDGQYAFHKNTLLIIRLRDEQKMINLQSNSAAFNPVVTTQKRSIRLQMQYPLSHLISGKSRVEWVTYTEAGQVPVKGSLLFSEIKLQSRQKKYACTGRVTIFTTDDYDARIYAMEQDIPGQFSLALLQHSGIRYALLIQFKPIRKMTIWLKYLHTQYQDVDTIGSGLEEIEGSRLREIRVQLNINF